ncbi:MAG: Spy/CpxP family protein refolding chaperone [Beijerinckiaceae bacterium]
MTRQFAFGLAVSALLAGTGLAFAQSAAPAPAAAPAATAPAPAVQGRGARMIDRMCSAAARPASSRYADRLAERLTLNDQQKGLLKAWQDARQKSREDMRTALCSPKPDMSTFIGRLDWRGKRLEAQLAAWKAERPKLEAFYASLDDKQKAAWDDVRQQAEERRGRRGRR